MRRIAWLALVVALPLTACASSPRPPSQVFVPPTPDAYGVIQCMQNTDCFWRIYQRCAGGAAARVDVLFAQSTDGNGNVVRRWRTLSSGASGTPCIVDVFEQVTVEQRNGVGGGAPGAIYGCTQVTRDAMGALHLADCHEGGSTLPDIAVAVHG